MTKILLLTDDTTLASEIANAVHPASLQAVSPSASLHADRLAPHFDAVILDSRKEGLLSYANWDHLPSLLLISPLQAKSSSGFNWFTEPFSSAEIRARLRLLKCAPRELIRSPFPNGELIIYLTNKVLKGAKGQTRIGNAGARLAELLFTNVGSCKTFSIGDIAAYTGCAPTETAVRMIVCRLRRNLTRVGSPAHIVTTKKPSGYKALFPDGNRERVRVIK